jgi:AAA+ ATPase superfamily predicted ATPase
MATVEFLNRERELELLEEWWASPPASKLALIWGRRRVGKTALLQRFADGKRTVFHTGAGRPVEDELRILSRLAAGVIEPGFRDLEARPFADWEDLLETLATAARDEPLLLILDEFPDLTAVAPDLENRIRAFWDRARGRTKLRILLCGSAVRTMEAIQEERAPLYGRIELSLLLQPFRPHEAALMLRRLSPPDRALVWGLVGGIPLYLEWWNQSASIDSNLLRLVCTPGGHLLTAGELALASELDSGELARQILYAIAAGRTKHSEIEDAVRADPARPLERLVRLGFVERMIPVTSDPRRTRLRLYRIADNFLAFWLALVDPYRAEIERGLGRSILPVLKAGLNDFLGPRYEEAFRAQLRLLAEQGQLAPGVVAIGPFWTSDAQPVEIDAVALAGRAREAVLVGESKWARRVDARRIRRDLERKAEALPKLREPLQFAVGARETVDNLEADILPVTAGDIFP